MVGGRRQRREFVKVALDALSRAVKQGVVNTEKGDAIARALRTRPRIVEQVRAAFVNDTDSKAIQSAETEKGKIDFDRIIDLLTSFFPKLVKFKVFAKLMADILKPQA